MVERTPPASPAGNCLNCGQPLSAHADKNGPTGQCRTFRTTVTYVIPPASPAEPGDAWDRILADPELARARQKLSIHEIRMIVKHARATPPVPAAKDEEVARSVNILRMLATDWNGEQLVDGEPIRDFLSAGEARKAADLLARVANERNRLTASATFHEVSRDKWQHRATAAEARLAEVEKERDEARAYAAEVRLREKAVEDARVSAVDRLAEAERALREIADPSKRTDHYDTAVIARAALAAMEAGDGK